MATVHRPAPLPPRPGTTQAAPQAAAKKPLPAGAAAWSRTYLDGNDRPQAADHLVPVDADQHRTAHVRHVCRGHIEVDGVKQGCDQTVWLLPGDKPRFCPDHGCALTADGKAKGEPWLPWAAIRRSVAAPSRPLWVLAAELAAGIGEYAGHVPWWQPLAAAPLAVGGAWYCTRTFLTNRAVKRGRLEPGQKTGKRAGTIARRARAAAYTATAASGWLTAAAAADPHSGAGKVVWCSLPLWYAATAPTWLNHVASLRNRPKPKPESTDGMPAAEQAWAADPAAVRDRDDWAAEVAQPGAGLPNTFVDVTTWKADVGGRRMVIRAQRGALTDEKIRAAVPLVAAAFNVASSAIGWVAEYEGSPKSALLLVQPNSPLNEPVPWEPVDIVDIDDAVAHIGTRIDGSRLVTRLWTAGWGAPSRAIFGTKGSGKTEYERLLLLIMLKARVQGPTGPVRLVAPFLHDPKLGKDFGAFRRQVCGFSTTSDCLHMIVEAFIREMDRRYAALALETWRDAKGRLQEGERPFDPTTMGSILSLVIDEFHMDAKDQALMAKLEPMARKMRAAGIEVVTATHMATLGDTGSQAFRDMLAGGEATLFRTTSGLNAALATGGTLVGDPRALPRVPGMNLHASGEEHTMQARMAYVPSDELYDLLYDDDNESRIQPVSWPAETLAAFGPDFVDWMRACQSRRPGDPAPATPKAYVGGAAKARAAVAADARNSLEALRQIVFGVEQPVGREQIAAHPLWLWGGVTSTTLGNALRKAQDDGWLTKMARGKGVEFVMTDAERERLQAVRDEQGEAAA